MTAIIASLSAIVAGLIWLLQRWLKRKDDPQRQYQQSKNENARIIENGDADALNRKLDADLDRLPDTGSRRDPR